MGRKRILQGELARLTANEQVRRVVRDGKTWFAAPDVVKALVNTRRPAEAWEALKQREPQLARLAQTVEVAGPEGQAGESVEAVDMTGLLRLVQSLPSPKAEKIKNWLARAAVERLEEEKNPELAVLRTRKLYESRGYSRRWVDKRLRGVSARHELTGEWYKRGATESDQFRALTNTIMERGFGMDVEHYRRHKNLFKTGENLRDHMSDLELALTALGETAAVELHRDRDSRSFEQLVSDAQDAGDIVARTRSEIENKLGHGVVGQGNHRDWWTRRRAQRGLAQRVTEVQAHGAHAAAAEAAHPGQVQAEREHAPQTVEKTNPDVDPADAPQADRAVA